MRITPSWPLAFAAGLFFLLGPAPAPAYENEMRLLAKTVAERLLGAEKRTVGVIDFTDPEGRSVVLGSSLAEELSVALAASGYGLDVVDRAYLMRLLSQDPSAGGGVVEAFTRGELGALAEAEALVTGTLRHQPQSVRLTVEILDTESAEILFTQALSLSPLVRRNPLTAVGFEFDLKGCSLGYDQTVFCCLEITNEGGDRQLAIRQPTSIFDDLGNRYPSRAALLGNAGAPTLDLAFLDQDLAAGVSTRAELSFPQVVPGAFSLRLLELSYAAVNSFSYTEFRIRFEHVGLSVGERLCRARGRLPTAGRPAVAVRAADRPSRPSRAAAGGTSRLSVSQALTRARLLATSVDRVRR